MGILTGARSAKVERVAEPPGAIERRALVDLLSVWAREGFSVGGQSRAELTRWVEAWKPCLLAGRGGGPGSEAGAGSVDLDLGDTYAQRPELAALLQAAAARRRNEARFVQSALPALAAVFMEVVMEAKDGLLEDARDDEEITRATAHLEAAVTGGEPAQIKARAEQVLRVVHRKADSRRRRSEARMRALGEKLAAQRETLVDPETRAAIDPVTGLPSRHALEAILERERLISQLARAPASVAKLGVVTTHGGATTGTSRDMLDRVMGLVAERVRPHVEPGFFLGRFSGDQLLVVMPDVDELAAADHATAYVKAVLSKPMELGGRAFKIPFFGGVAECLAEERRDEWVLRADEALDVARVQTQRRAVRYAEL